LAAPPSRCCDGSNPPGPSSVTVAPATGCRVTASYTVPLGSSGRLCSASVSPACSVISVPARYIHSPVEVLSLRDLDNGAALIAAAIERAHEYF